MPGEMHRLLLTAAEAAETLSVSRSTLYSLVSEGRLKRVKLRNSRAGGIRFRPCDLEEFAEQNLK
jgi:excisionase family DNA binding protein